MPHVRLLPLGFLAVAALTLAVPAVFAAWTEVQPVDRLLHDTYYVVLPVLGWAWLIFAPLVICFVYLSGQRFAGLEFKRPLVWLNLLLWVLGTGILLVPTFAVSAVHMDSPSNTVGYSIDFEALGRIFDLGYCVTLLSATVFAICVGEAVLRRLRTSNRL